MEHNQKEKLKYSHVRSAKQFLTELKKEYPDTKWTYIPGGDIRTTTNNKYKYRFCPVTYAAYKVTGEKFDNGDADIAAEAIGLKTDICWSVVGAADNTVKSNLRKTLLDILF